MRKHTHAVYNNTIDIYSFIDKVAFWQLQNPHNFEVGSMVRHGVPARYGVIKWIGILPNNLKVAYAGLEMVGILYAQLPTYIAIDSICTYIHMREEIYVVAANSYTCEQVIMD